MKGGHFALEFLDAACDGCDGLVILGPVFPVFLHLHQSFAQFLYLNLCCLPYLVTPFIYYLQELLLHQLSILLGWQARMSLRNTFYLRIQFQYGSSEFLDHLHGLPVIVPLL